MMNEMSQDPCERTRQRAMSRCGGVAAIMACLSLACACGHHGSSESKGKATQAQLAALPASTRVIVGFDVARLASSGIARRAIGLGLGADGRVAGRVADLLARCKLDPARDLATVVVGIGPDSSDIAVVADGKLDEKQLVDCARAGVAEAGGTFEAKGGGAWRTYVASDPKAPARAVYLAFSGTGTVVLATSEPLLRSIVDPAAPKAIADPVMGKLLARIHPGAAVWGAGRLDPSAGAKVAEMVTERKLAPAQAVLGTVDLDSGLGLELAVDMENEQDASALSTVMASQLPWLGIAAGRWGLGAAASRARVSVDGKAVKMTLRLEATDVASAEAALAKATGEPGAGGPGK